ncbi:hypothetical protein [Mesorhizobium prunaredense]|uniref:hypothetical protein n=1 Tax=Mesorhizobium prunaredense TaxID=1631249 RepID=UPI001AECAE28|nr:hypothetical protein [Mesorhizobium prunaredense]
MEINGIERIQNLVWGAGQHLTIGPGCQFQSALSYLSSSTTAQMRAVNYTGGILPNPAVTNPERNLEWQGSSQQRYKPDLSSSDMLKTGGAAYFHDSHRLPWRIGIREVHDSFGRRWDIRDCRAFPTELGASHTSTRSKPTPETFRFTYPASLQSGPNSNLYEIEPGDILVHLASGTIFLVEMVTMVFDSYQVDCAQQNAYDWIEGTVFTPLHDVLMLGGNLRLFKTGVMISSKVFFGDFRTGSATVANVSAHATTGSDIESHLAVGDCLHGPKDADSYLRFPVGPDTKIATITPGNPASLTLTTEAILTGRFPVSTVDIR